MRIGVAGETESEVESIESGFRSSDSGPFPDPFGDVRSFSDTRWLRGSFSRISPHRSFKSRWRLMQRLLMILLPQRELPCCYKSPDWFDEHGLQTHAKSQAIRPRRWQFRDSKRRPVHYSQIMIDAPDAPESQQQPSPPRAFTQGVGTVFQFGGVVLFVLSMFDCCTSSLLGKPAMTHQQ